MENGAFSGVVERSPNPAGPKWSGAVFGSSTQEESVVQACYLTPRRHLLSQNVDGNPVRHISYPFDSCLATSDMLVNKASG